jgi:DNA ligase (NAD+)
MSAKTDYLITNDADSGSEKNKKAAELGIVVISEAKFLNMCTRK